MKNRIMQKQGGFSLIELLVVIGMLGLLMTAVYSLYWTHQHSAYTQDEVVEVQQNLRIGMDSITKDIRMAGFLLPGSAFSPVSLATSSVGTAQPLPAPNDVASDSLTLQAVNASYVVSRITVSQTGLGTFTVDDVGGFKSGDITALITALTKTSIGGLAGSDRFTATVATGATTSITLSGSAGGGVTFTPTDYDMIVKLDKDSSGSAVYPSTIQYCLGSNEDSPCCPAVDSCPAGQLCLMRIVNGTTNVIAQNIANLRFSYLLDNNTETASPATADYRNIRAVRVTLIGQTIKTRGLSNNQSKVKQLQTVLGIRNR